MPDTYLIVNGRTYLFKANIVKELVLTILEHQDLLCGKGQLVIDHTSASLAVTHRATLKELKLPAV